MKDLLTPAQLEALHDQLRDWAAKDLELAITRAAWCLPGERLCAVLAAALEQVQKPIKAEGQRRHS